MDMWIGYPVRPEPDSKDNDIRLAVRLLGWVDIADEGLTLNNCCLIDRRRSYPARPEPDSKDKVIRFAVRSLGWVEIAEEDLTPERSSKAVNKCIVDLSLGRNDLIDNVGRWGDVSQQG